MAISLANIEYAFYNRGVDNIVRLSILSEQMALEPAEDHSMDGSPCISINKNRPDTVFVHPAVLPNGKRIKLLKTLLTSVCERDCYYCPFRAGRDCRRATFQPEEFARLFVMLSQKGIAEGVFLSSGMVGGGIRTQDKLIDTAEIMRHKLGFNGYIHLKIMPGAERSQVEQAMRLADRVSINLEAPNDKRLVNLAPQKQFSEELLQPLKWIDEIRRTQPGYLGWKGRWPSSVTMFVAGGAGESDLELLSTTDYLYRQLRLRRAYFSPFNPIPETPMENQPATPVIREHRLYQASYLLRDYGFDLEELPFEADGRLPIQTDPKLAWAQRNLFVNPIEINKAEKATLMRVPGIGSRGADAILRARRHSKIRDIGTLKKMGIVAEQAAAYILFDGRSAALQPALF
jgi:predicted DNA-binding helix-hairpin-helix protein